MKAPRTPPCVLDFLNGYALLGAANAAAQLRLPQILSRNHGLSIAEIAQEILAQAKSPAVDHVDQNGHGQSTPNAEEDADTADRRHVALHRILRFLSAHSLVSFHVDAHGRETYSLPTLPEGAEDPWPSIAPYAAFMFHPYQHSTWLKLPDMILRGGDPGHGPKFYQMMDSDPALRLNFDAAMAAISSSYVNAFCNTDCYDMDPDRKASCLVDVGGGAGFAAARLARRYPHITRVLNFDLPLVIATAPHHDGVEHIQGDMFESIPSADIMFFKSVLHNWPDEHCVDILRNCRKSLVGCKKVVILDSVIDSTIGTVTDNTGNISNMLGRLSLDLSMMANHFEGARERTKNDWERILRAAGFESYKFVELHDSLYCVIEATMV